MNHFGRVTWWTVAVAAVAAVGAGGLFGQALSDSSSEKPPAPTDDKEPTLTQVEERKIKPLRELAQAGKHEELLAKTVGMDLKDRTYEFRREVLGFQAAAFRRTGKAMSAMSTMKRLTQYAAKLPAFRRKKEVNRLVLPTQVLMLAKTGRYVSPAKRGKPADGPDRRGLDISDDSNWSAAQDDYARYLLGRLDVKIKRLDRITTPGLLLKKMLEALRVTDVVRPHMPALANEKARAVADAFVRRQGAIIEGQRSLRLAPSLCDGSLLPKGKGMSPKVRRGTALRIVNDLRKLYLINYEWGKALTRYGREQGVAQELDGPVSALDARCRSLRSTFVEADNYAFYGTYYGPNLIRKNEPLKKIPTAPW